MSERTYLLVIHPAEEGGYWAEFPSVPGCYVQGETLDELIGIAPSLLESHVKALIEDGQALPREDTVLIASVRVGEVEEAHA